MVGSFKNLQVGDLIRDCRIRDRIAAPNMGGGDGYC